MDKNKMTTLAYHVAIYAYGLFTWCFFGLQAFFQGSFFSRESEQDRLQLQIERDRFWNLARQPLPGFHHAFYTLRNGRQLHYICNRTQKSPSGNLCVFVHGFPDTCMVWRYLMTESSMPVLDATFVCVDMPGYGGSDSWDSYGTAALEALSEFIVAMRDQYIGEDSGQRTFYIGHDWGCVIGYRLAVEAPLLVDRFILMNGPHPALLTANGHRIMDSATKIFRQFRQSPRKNFGCLTKTIRVLKPLLHQLFVSGYIFAFQLPDFMVKICLTSANSAFLNGALKLQHGKHRELYKEQESMAASQGPSMNECKSSSSEKQNGNPAGQYGRSVIERSRSRADAMFEPIHYYQQNAIFAPWTKSLETIAELYDLESSASQSKSPTRRRSVSSLFPKQSQGVLGAPVTALWSGNDFVLGRAIMIDGLGDYLARDSEVILLPKANHWIPVEKESRAVLAKVIHLFAASDNKQKTHVADDLMQSFSGLQVLAKR